MTIKYGRPRRLLNYTRQNDFKLLPSAKTIKYGRPRRLLNYSRRNDYKLFTSAINYGGPTRLQKLYTSGMTINYCRPQRTVRDDLKLAKTHSSVDILFERTQRY